MENFPPKHRTQLIARLICSLYVLWRIHTGRNREQMACMKPCGSFHITPEPGQGPRPIVRHCFSPGPWSRFRSAFSVNITGINPGFNCLSLQGFDKLSSYFYLSQTTSETLSLAASTRLGYRIE